MTIETYEKTESGLRRGEPGAVTNDAFYGTYTHWPARFCLKGRRIERFAKLMQRRCDDAAVNLVAHKPEARRLPRDRGHDALLSVAVV